MLKIIKKLIPPQKWKIPVIVLMGMLVGTGVTAIYLSNAVSYLSDDPAACVNCHIMTPHFATWFHSSHRERATCNDCHVPHDNVFRKYYFKAQDGLRHASIFTVNAQSQVITIKEAGATVVQENCIRCHETQVNPVSSGNITFENHLHGEGHLCWDCHREVPHGRVRSEASTPYARVPSMNSAIPDWIKNLNK